MAVVEKPASVFFLAPSSCGNDETDRSDILVSVYLDIARWDARERRQPAGRACNKDE